MFPAYAGRVRLWRRPEDRRPDPEVVHTDDRGAVLLGTVVWVVALVVCLVDRERLVAGGDGWWVWVCVAGIGLGAIGLVHVHRQHLRHERAQRHAAPQPDHQPARHE